MAVTIEQVPRFEVRASGNPVIWVFSSNQTGQVNFSYYVEVYVDAVLNSSHQVFPESGIYGKFDASQIIESELTAPSFPTVETGEDSNSWGIVNLKVYERYGTTPTLQASAISSNALCVKGKHFLNAWINSDLDLYFVDDVDKRWRTDCPNFSLRSGELLSLYYTADSYGNATTLELNYKDIDGTSLNTESISVTGYRDTAIQVSWDILNGYYPLTSVSTVEVSVDISSGGETTIPIIINIDHCTRPDTTRLHFLTQLGGIDAFTFDAVSKQSMNTQTNSFLTTQGGFDGSAFTYSTTNSQTGNYQVTSNTKLMLESNWINEDIMQWLNDNLFTSPYILLETENGLQRVANTSASVKYKKNRNDMTFNVVIELDLEMHSSMII